jgi:hypothetical protein
LPAFEAPVAPPPVQARPAEPPAAATPVETNPFKQPVEASPFARPAQAKPFAPPAHASSLLQPLHESPFMQAAQASPSAQEVVHTSPTAPAVHTSPIAPAVYARPTERPVYPLPFERPEDVNPIVRPESHVAKPMLEAAALASPSAQPVVELAASNIAPPVVEAAASNVALPVVEPAASNVALPVVEPAASNAPPPVVEAAASPVALPVVELAASPVAPPVVEAAASPVTPVVEAATSASTSEPALAEAPIAEAPAKASAVEVPVVNEPVVGATAQASAFETAPTEFALSETPIVRPLDAEPALAPIETPAPSSAESVVGEAEIREYASRVTQPYPGPPRSFTSSGSEMPVVITTPAPYRRDSSTSASNLFGLGRELLPRAQAWSKKTLRENPRALVAAAPLLALLGIWAVRSAFSHPKHTPAAEANSAVAAQTAQTSAAAIAPAASVGSPAAILVSTSVAATAAPPAADPAELASAVTHGLPALEALAQKYPNDPQVGIALASQQAQAQRFEAAVGSVERVIQADPKSAQNGKVMGILWRAAQSDASEPTFLALRRLGARGADIAFDLATTSGVRDSVRERAKSELEKSLSPEASGDTRVASALLLASDCKARKSLLARAEHEGGKRTRALLEQYSRGSTCTSSTDKACNTCLTGSPALTHALAQLSAGGQK